MGIFDFVLDTLTDWSSDPNNQKYFLPSFLATVDGGKYVPYQVALWTLVAQSLTETSGPAICNQWAIIQDTFPLGDQGIASGNATLELQNVIVQGLNNLVLEYPQLTALGQNQVQATYLGQLNTYSSSVAQQFSLAGSFEMTQPCCSAPAKSNQCDGQMSAQINGTGTFGAILQSASATIPPPQVSIVLVFSFQEGPFQINVSVPPNGILFQGGLDVNNIVINNDNQGYGWTQAAQILFAQEQTKQQILAAFNQELNQPGNLSSLASAVQTQVNSLVAELGGTSNPASNVASDQFFIDLFESGLNAPSSKLYLPIMVQNATNPVLEPLTIIAGTKDLGNQTIPSIDVTVDLQLSGVSLAGLSNVQVLPANVQVDGDTVTFLAQFSLLEGFPPQLTLSGSMQVSNVSDGTLDGTLSIAITSSSIQGIAQITGEDADTLQITLQQMTLQPLEPSDVTATVNLQDTAQFFDNFAAKMIESGPVLTAIVTQINDAIANNLTAVSTQMTQVARSMLQKGL